MVLDHRHWISRHTFCNDHLDQQSHKRRLHEWNSVTGLSMEYFSTIGSDVAIWGSVHTWCPGTSTRAPAQNGAVFRHTVPSLKICSHSINRAHAHYCTVGRHFEISSGYQEKRCVHIGARRRIEPGHGTRAPSVNTAWLANLRLSVRVRTMLLASTCHAMPILAVKHRWFTRITWHRCCGKKQIDS